MSSERELSINRLRNPDRTPETIKKIAKQIARDKRAVDPARIKAYHVLKRYFIIELKIKSKEWPIEDRQLLRDLYNEPGITSIYKEIAEKICDCKYLRELDAAENVIKELVTLKGNISMAYLSINNYPLEFLDFVNCVKLTNLNLDSYGDNIEKLYLKCDHVT
nr:11638_t:CDS:2 [Entrophospora candida]